MKLEVTTEEDVKMILNGQKTFENIISRESLSNDKEDKAKSKEIKYLIEGRLIHDYGVMIKFGKANYRKYKDNYTCGI